MRNTFYTFQVWYMCYSLRVSITPSKSKVKRGLWTAIILMWYFFKKRLLSYKYKFKYNFFESHATWRILWNDILIRKFGTKITEVFWTVNCMLPTHLHIFQGHCSGRDHRVGLWKVKLYSIKTKNNFFFQIKMTN